MGVCGLVAGCRLAVLRFVFWKGGGVFVNEQARFVVVGQWNGPEGSGSRKGAPKGHQYGSRYNHWRSQIERALTKKGKCEQAEELYKIAENLIECAKDPESPHYEFAVKEIGNRLDGKPKERIELDEGTATALGVGISAAFAQLVKITREGETIDGEVVVPDRSLLSSEVCPETGGRGEGVGIPKVSGGSE